MTNANDSCLDTQVTLQDIDQSDKISGGSLEENLGSPTCLNEGADNDIGNDIGNMNIKGYQRNWRYLRNRGQVRHLIVTL